MKTALDRFGELLMKQVRDEAITDWDMTINGQMKDSHSQLVREMLVSFDDRQLDVLRYLIPQIVDTTLHHLLWTLEREESLDVAVQTETGNLSSLREISDGLAGELYGWIPRFSTQRYKPKV